MCRVILFRFLFLHLVCVRGSTVVHFCFHCFHFSVLFFVRGPVRDQSTTANPATQQQGAGTAATMTSLQLFGTMEVQAVHMKPQSSGMTGLMEGDEDLMSKAWSTTPLPMCPKCKTYNNINPVFSGTPGTKLKEMMDRTKLVKHVPGAKPHEIGFCQTCKSLVPSNGDLRPMFTQPKYKYLSYQVSSATCLSSRTTIAFLCAPGLLS